MDDETWARFLIWIDAFSENDLIALQEKMRQSGDAKKIRAAAWVGELAGCLEDVKGQLDA